MKWQISLNDAVELEAVILTESFHILNSTPSPTKSASGLHFRAHARAGGGMITKGLVSTWSSFCQLNW